MENSIIFDIKPRDINDIETRHASTLVKVLHGDSINMKGNFLEDRGFENFADVIRVRLQEMASRGMAVNLLGFYQTFIQELELSQALAPELGDIYTGVEKDMLPTFADFVNNALDEQGKVPHDLDNYMVGVHHSIVERYKNYRTSLGRKLSRQPHEATLETGLYKMAYAYMVAQESGVFTQEVMMHSSGQELHACKLVQGEPTTNVVDGLALLLYSHNRYDEKTVESVVTNWRLSGDSYNHWSEHGTAINNTLDLAQLKTKIDYYKDKYPMPFADTHPLNKNS